MSILTDARRAVWDSIDNWGPLRDVFKMKVAFDSNRLEGPHRPEGPTGVADLPAIAIVPSRVTPRWVTNQTQNHPYVLRVSYWTPDFLVDKAEELWDEIVKAVYRAHPNPEYPRDTYLKRATGISMPIGFGPSTTTRVELNKVPAFRIDFDLVLKITVSPLTGVL
jgi:hypothetical protein